MEREQNGRLVHFSRNFGKVWISEIFKASTAWKVSKYGVISGPYFPVFGPNTGKYGPEITLHLDIFHAVVELRSPNNPHWKPTIIYYQ